MVSRKGFTIVELLVSLALVVFIMSILSEAFIVATNTFRNLKAAGDLAEKLRSAGDILTRDLSSDHFDGKRRLSDPLFWKNGPPTEGFFRIYQASALSNVQTANYAVSGYDLDGLPSYQAIDHCLHFTVKLRGNGRGDYFTAAVPAGSPLLTWDITDGIQPWHRYQDPNGTAFNSQWAEVAYFLQATGDLTTGPAPQPLFALFRQQRLLLPDTTATAVVDAVNSSTLYPGVSTYAATGGVGFNSPADITVPSRRFGGLTSNYQSLAQVYSGTPALFQQYAGSDVLLTDVISFEVRPCFVLSTGTPLTGASGTATVPATTTLSAFVPLSDPNVVTYQNNPSFNGAAGPFVFDTWSQVLPSAQYPGLDYSNWTAAGTATSIPLWSQTGPQLTVKAIQIVVRVWDYKTLQSRQVTIIQDL